MRKMGIAICPLRYSTLLGIVGQTDVVQEYRLSHAQNQVDYVLAKIRLPPPAYQSSEGTVIFYSCVCRRLANNASC